MPVAALAPGYTLAYFFPVHTLTLPPILAPPRAVSVSSSHISRRLAESKDDPDRRGQYESVRASYKSSMEEVGVLYL